MDAFKHVDMVKRTCWSDMVVVARRAVYYTPHGQTVSSASPGSAPRPPPHRVCPKHLPKNASSGHPDQMPEPPQLTDLELQLRGGKYHV